jgi:lipopolysaccharide export LptBFGC system permease protein LptF
MTKYYEYGRYDAQDLGLVMKAKNLPDVKVINNKIDLKSLKKPLAFISRVSGQSGKIQGVYIEVKNKYKVMLDYAELRKKQNNNPQRKSYDLNDNNCIHFAKEVTEKAGINTPWMIDPRPNSYIGEFRDEFLDLDFSNNILKIEKMGIF